MVKDTFFVCSGRMTLRHPTGMWEGFIVVCGLYSGGTVENRPTAGNSPRSDDSQASHRYLDRLHSGGTTASRPTARDDYCILKVTVFVPALPSLSVAVMVMLALPTGASVAIGMVIPVST